METYVVSSDAVKIALDGVTANIGVILPVGIAIFAIMIGVALVPKLVKHFTSK